MDTWITFKIHKDDFNAEIDTIVQALMSRCGAIGTPDSSGYMTYQVPKFGTGMLTQAQILYCYDQGLDFNGTLFEPYYMVIPVAMANANIPAGYPDRTYVDEEGNEVVRKVKDYIAWYQLSQDKQTALIRCTHLATPDATAGTPMDPDKLKRWITTARNIPVHVAIGGQWLIESKQANELLQGDYASGE